MNYLARIFCSLFTGSRILYIVFFTLSGSACAQNGNSAPTQTSEPEKSFYSLGYDFGKNLTALKNQGIKFDQTTVIKGVQDAMSGNQPAFSKEEMQRFLDALMKAMTQTANQAPPVTQTESPARVGGFVDDYAKLNAARPGVTVTPSGVQYEVLQAGNGPQVKSSDTVMVNYQGTLTNGTVFDGTYDDGKPAPLKLDEIAVPGLKEALLLMHVGDKWRVVVPPNMGFVNFGNNRLRRRDLIYEIEIIGVEKVKKK